MVPKRQAAARAAPKVITLDLPCTSDELSELKKVLPIFRCTILPSDAESEGRVVELVQWLLSISRNQKREAE